MDNVIACYISLVCYSEDSRILKDVNYYFTLFKDLKKHRIWLVADAMESYLVSRVTQPFDPPGNLTHIMIQLILYQRALEPSLG